MKHKCFELVPGVRVHGNPDMDEKTRNALIELVEAAKQRLKSFGETQKPLRRKITLEETPSKVFEKNK